MKNKLNDYIKGKIYYTPILNILMNNRTKDWYADLGKYIDDTIDISKVPYLSFSEKHRPKNDLKTKIKDFLNPNNRFYSSIAISFLTGVLDDEVLRKMFGEPIYHDEFGEGFDGEYNEEDDDYGEPDIKESYASYFVNVGGTEFHIGYDHRGTGIEVGVSKKHEFNNNPTDKQAKDCLDALKKIVDLYKQTFKF